MKPLILIGGGGHCKSVIEVAESVGREIKGIFDLPEKVGGQVLGYPIIGTEDDIERYAAEAQFIITVGFIKDPSNRLRIFDKLVRAGADIATLIASTARVSRHAVIGCGTVVMHYAFVNAGAVIGENVIINTYANIEHDATVGSQTHISTGAMVNGNCRVGQRCFVGSQSVMANATSIADDIVVGAGALVRKSLVRKGIYSGNPALLKIVIPS